MTRTVPTYRTGVRRSATGRSPLRLTQQLPLTKKNLSSPVVAVGQQDIPTEQTFIRLQLRLP